MKFTIIIFVLNLVFIVSLQSQVPALPEGGQTKWIVEGPEEVVSYLIFDPLTVKERIPPFLRFISIEELANDQVEWAKDHMLKYPTQASWGISFIEIVRMETFAIDGHSPNWPNNGAVALWFARVAPKNPKIDLGPGKPFLALDFWMPDSNYVSYMLDKGYYASYGDIQLYKNLDDRWTGSIKTNDLSLVLKCKTTHKVEGFGSRGMHIIFPPAQTSIKNFTRIAFAGHQELLCEKGAIWKFQGTHPLVCGVILGETIFQYGYELVGGVYH